MTADLTLSETGLERLPPQSIEAEQAILGALLISNETISRVIDVLNPEHFYRKAHQIICAAIIDLFEKNEPVDIITVSQFLKDQGKLDIVGGRQYLTDLALSIATTASAEWYAKTVNEKALLRNLIKAGTEIVASCYEEVDADICVDKAEQLIFSIAQRRSMQSLTHVKDIVNESFARIEQRYENRDALSGIPTGFYDLDEMTSGWQKSDLIILAARPSMGKCLAADSEILLEDGSLSTIEDIYSAGNATLLTLDDQHKLRWTNPSAFIDDGIKPVFEVTTRLGRKIQTTLTHPFLTINGWQPLSQLQPGQHIAVPRTLPSSGQKKMRECEIKLLAYLIGDGAVSSGKVGFTNGNPKVQADFQQAADAFGKLSVRTENDGKRTTTLFLSKNRQVVRLQRVHTASQLRSYLQDAGITARRLAKHLKRTTGTISHWLSGKTAPSDQDWKSITQFLSQHEIAATSGKRELVDTDLTKVQVSYSTLVKPERWCSAGELVTWLQSHELYGKTAHEKSIPKNIFALRSQDIALFLNRLFSTDGWASVYASGQSQIGYATVNERLARQIQHLLLRFSIIAKLKKRKVNYAESTRHCWQIEITDSQSLRRFIDSIGIFGKEAAIEKVSAALAERRVQTNCDLIPMEVWNNIAVARGAESWASVARRSGMIASNLHIGTRQLTRGRLLQFATALEDDRLAHLANSDIYWDQIVSIKYVGDKQVYDLTVPETHNFIANDICVHNTAFCLNLAQHAAVEGKMPVCLFSLEMSKEQLVTRLLCAEARIDANKMRTGFLQSSDWQSLATAMGRLSEAPIFIDDSPAVSALDVRAKARRLKSEYKELGLIIIDYIQLMQGRSKGDGNRTQEISEISRGLKQLARELNCPVIALSQLSRAVEARQNKRPMLSDLRESGAIEQDADIVMFIYRDEYYNAESDKRGEAEIIIAKQRNGPVGTVELLYQASITRFLNKAVTNTYAAPAGQ